jgi:hypothetical protein
VILKSLLLGMQKIIDAGKDGDGVFFDDIDGVLSEFHEVLTKVRPFFARMEQADEQAK